ncbi:MAG TPA: hypothetical protein VFW40_02330, partial [Capsulimonadaceae bacterium]|nr:hypothetical protein [Capsulimonadaceae bacterium]
AMAAPRVATITSSGEHPPADDTLQSLHAAGIEVGQTRLLSSFTLRLGHYPEEPILWSTSEQAAPQPATPQPASTAP